MQQSPSSELETIAGNIGQMFGVALGIANEPDHWVFVDKNNNNASLGLAISESELEGGAWVHEFVGRAFSCCLSIIAPALPPAAPAPEEPPAPPEEA